MHSVEVPFLSTIYSRSSFRCLLQLNEFDITVETLRGLRNQALLDLLAWFPYEEPDLLQEGLPKRYAQWKSNSGASPSVVLPPIEEVAQELYCMASISFSPSN